MDLFVLVKILSPTERSLSMHIKRSRIIFSAHNILCRESATGVDNIILFIDIYDLQSDW